MSARLIDAFKAEVECGCNGLCYKSVVDEADWEP